MKRRREHIAALRVLPQRFPQNIDDLRTQDIVRLKLRQKVDEIVITAFVELSDDVRTRVSLSR